MSLSRNISLNGIFFSVVSQPFVICQEFGAEIKKWLLLIFSINKVQYFRFFRLDLHAEVSPWVEGPTVDPGKDPDEGPEVGPEEGPGNGSDVDPWNGPDEGPPVGPGDIPDGGPAEGPGDGPGVDPGNSLDEGPPVG